MANGVGGGDPLSNMMTQLFQLEEVRRGRSLEDLQRRTETSRAVASFLPILQATSREGRPALARGLSMQLGVSPEVLMGALEDTPESSILTGARGAETGLADTMDLRRVMGTPASFFTNNPTALAPVQRFAAVKAATGEDPQSVKGSSAVSGLPDTAFTNAFNIGTGQERSVGQTDALDQWAKEFGLREEQFKENTEQFRAQLAQSKTQFGQNLGYQYQSLAQQGALGEASIAIQRGQVQAEQIRAMAAARAAGNSQALEQIKEAVRISETMIKEKLKPEAQRIHAAYLFSVVPPEIIKSAFGLASDAPLTNADMQRLLNIDAEGFWGSKDTSPGPMQIPGVSPTSPMSSRPPVGPIDPRVPGVYRPPPRKP